MERRHRRYVFHVCGQPIVVHFIKIRKSLLVFLLLALPSLVVLPRRVVLLAIAPIPGVQRSRLFTLLFLSTTEAAQNKHAKHNSSQCNHHGFHPKILAPRCAHVPVPSKRRVRRYIGVGQGKRRGSGGGGGGVCPGQQGIFGVW